MLAGDNGGPGLAVLLGHGMKAWMEAGVRNSAPQAWVATGTGPLQTAPAEWRSQLTAVLAGMVLRGCHEWRHA